MSFEIRETDRFQFDLEEAAFWLYSHNLEQSQEFADRKFLELEQEINALKNYLCKTPRMGQADEITGLRRFPIYEGRYSATWVIDESNKVVTLLAFQDSKYPNNLREFKFDE